MYLGSAYGMTWLTLAISQRTFYTCWIFLTPARLQGSAKPSKILEDPESELGLCGGFGILSIAHTGWRKTRP